MTLVQNRLQLLSGNNNLDFNLNLRTSLFLMFSIKRYQIFGIKFDTVPLLMIE